MFVGDTTGWIGGTSTRPYSDQELACHLDSAADLLGIWEEGVGAGHDWGGDGSIFTYDSRTSPGSDGSSH